MSDTWSPNSWKNFDAKQLPTYPDKEKLKETLDVLETLPPLVSAGECRKLKAEFASAARGEAFVLQGGDCAESFQEFHKDNITGTFKTLIQMNLPMMIEGGKPIVKVGRIAGQFAKPRSKAMETKDGITIPSYKGDIINGSEFTEDKRMPNPENMKEAYSQSAITLNYLRSLANGDYFKLGDAHRWTQIAFKDTPLAERHHKLLDEVDVYLEKVKNGEVDKEDEITKAVKGDINKVDFYTSHEALLLQYEEALTRVDSMTGDWYDTSAHMLWIGDRTRDPKGAHVEFLSGVKNPIGIKCGPTMKAEDLKALLDKLNPENEEGKIMLISRMGSGKVADYLPALIDVVEQGGYNVVWSCDPMHGNTYATSTGVKTRDFQAVKNEVREFFEVHRQKGTIAGGVHLEMTGQDVTECVGGVHGLDEDGLSAKYNTACDPRLNANQSLELAFLITDELRKDTVAKSKKIALAI